MPARRDDDPEQRDISLWSINRRIDELCDDRDELRKKDDALERSANSMLVRLAVLETKALVYGAIGAMIVELIARKFIK
jgi:hypothetical protein